MPLLPINETDGVNVNTYYLSENFKYTYDEMYAINDKYINLLLDNYKEWIEENVEESDRDNYYNDYFLEALLEYLFEIKFIDGKSFNELMSEYNNDNEGLINYLISKNYMTEDDLNTAMHTYDLGISWSWKDRTIAKDETQVYSVIFMAGNETINYELKSDKTTIDVNKDLVIKSNNNIDKFKSLYINNKLIDKKYYNIDYKNNNITLKKDYIKTLSTGKYTLKAVFEDGEGVFNFIIPEDNPKTLDEGATYIIISVISLIFIVGSVILFKKKKD